MMFHESDPPQPTNLEEERAKLLRNEARQPQFRYKDAAAVHVQAACRGHPPSDESWGRPEPPPCPALGAAAPGPETVAPDEDTEHAALVIPH